MRGRCCGCWFCFGCWEVVGVCEEAEKVYVEYKSASGKIGMCASWL